MHIYKIERSTILKTNIDDAWDFFSDPNNLNRITPQDMKFEILSDLSNLKMYPGMIINYRIMPLSGIRMRWTTEITHCQEKSYFIDEQRFGPYSFWHHQHHFKAIGQQVEMKDIVHYALPLGPFGRLLNRIYIQKKLDDIFTYREMVIKELFH